MRRFLVFSLLLAGCGSSSGDVVSSPAPLRLAALYNFTGAQASLDVPSAQGAQLAAQQSQRAVQLLLQDGQSDPNVLKAQAQQLLAQHPDAFMGLSDSNLVLAAAPPGQLFLTSGATSPLLPEQVPGVALACFGDNTQAAAAAEFAFNRLGVRTVSIGYDDTSDYTRGLETYFQTRFVQLGGTVVSKATLANLGSLSLQADMVFLSAQPQQALPGVQQLRTAGFAGPIMGGDAYDEPDFGPTHPEVSRVFFTTHADLTSTSPVVTSFVAAYQATFHTAPSAFSALGYDTVNLILKVADSGGDLSVLHGYQGVTGTFDYSGSRVPLKTVTVIEVEGGQRSVPASFVPAQVPSPDTPFLGGA